MFKIGDKVKILDEKAEGIIVKIISIDYYEVDIDGFIYQKRHSELTKHTFSSNEINKIEFKNIDLPKQNNDITEKNIDGIKIFYDSKIKSKIIEIDLHFHNITNNESSIKPSERLRFQLDFLTDWMNYAMHHRFKKVIIIHGVGTGVLKSEVLKLLKNYDKIVFYEGSMKKYGLGATEIRLF